MENLILKLKDININVDNQYITDNINNSINDKINQFYFEILIDNLIRKKIYLRCYCNNISYFLPNEKCTCGKIHKLVLKEDKYLVKNILYFSIDDFIFLEPYYII